MSFEISHSKQDGISVTEIKDTKNGTTIQIAPSSGALWHAWRVRNGEETVNLINNYKDEKDLAQNLTDSHKSAKLSPFACRIPKGKYIYKGKEYEFANKFSDGNAIHGLLVRKAFQQIKTEQNDDFASVSFQYQYRHEDNGYPFDYDCTVTYKLAAGNKVTLETIVKNISKETIPIVDGWHPYFTTGSKVDECKLQFYANQVVEFDEQLIPTGRLLPYDDFWTEKTIGQVELDHSFMLDKNAPQPRCTFSDPEKNIKIAVFPSAGYPILQLYIPPDRRSMAIETLSGAPDAFNNGIGLILLASNETKTFSVTFEASSGKL